MKFKKITLNMILGLIFFNPFSCEAFSLENSKKFVQDKISIANKKREDAVDWIKDNKYKTGATAVIIAGLLLYIVKLRLELNLRNELNNLYTDDLKKSFKSKLEENNKSIKISFVNEITEALEKQKKHYEEKSGKILSNPGKISLGEEVIKFMVLVPKEVLKGNNFADLFTEKLEIKN